MRLALAVLVSLAILASAPHALAGGENAGDFTLPSLSGDNVSLSDHLGKKVILVSFFATWCAPCIKEMGKLDTMQKELADRGFQVISISVDEARDKSKVKALIKRMRYSPPVLLDSDSKVINTYNPRKDMPWTMIIGLDKQIHHKKKGFTDGDEKKIRKWVEALLPAAG
jgi:peroxiredoxin